MHNFFIGSKSGDLFSLMCFSYLFRKESWKKKSIVNIVSALCFVHFSFIVVKVNLWNCYEMTSRMWKSTVFN